jgi:hypothetical protein
MAAVQDFQNNLNIPNINHYLSEKFWFALKDKRYQNWSGQLANININLGTGAFKQSFRDYYVPFDIFNYQAGYQPITQAASGELSSGSAISTDSGADIITQGFDADPVFQTIAVAYKDLPSNVADQNEYGYGFYFRYLTHFPQRMWTGKNNAWYFLSRLTNSKIFGDVAYGDRLLTIFQGASYYQFSTTQNENKNANNAQNIGFPEDIEALWTYVYFSHSRTAKRTTAFIKYGDAAPQRVAWDLTHPEINYIQFILGGKQFSYQSIQAQFYKVQFKFAQGAFIDTADNFNK